MDTFQIGIVPLFPGSIDTAVELLTEFAGAADFLPVSNRFEARIPELTASVANKGGKSSFKCARDQPLRRLCQSKFFEPDKVGA